MQFGEWKKRSRAYKRAIVEAEYPLDEKRIESLCRAAFVAGVDWGLETHDAKVGAGRTALKMHNAELSGPRPLAAEGSRSNDVLGAKRSGEDSNA